VSRHPGEKKNPSAITLGLGSAPHPWGELQPGHLQPDAVRVSPTSVGRGEPWHPVSCFFTGHPHMRGERFHGIPHRSQNSGPSPHAWGEGRNRDHTGEIVRAIPTCVGRGGTRTAAMRAVPGHPHMRGERSTAPDGSATLDGPYPHAWGEDQTASSSSCYRPEVVPSKWDLICQAIRSSRTVRLPAWRGRGAGAASGSASPSASSARVSGRRRNHHRRCNLG
jgi:hypothetical protein